MLHRLIGFSAIVTALFWGIVWLIFVPWLGILWCVTWIVVLCLDYQLYRDTAPSIPLIEAEVVEGGELLSRNERQTHSGSSH